MGRNDLGARVRKTAAKTRSHAVARAILIAVITPCDWRPGLELNQDEGRCPVLCVYIPPPGHRAGGRDRTPVSAREGRTLPLSYARNGDTTSELPARRQPISPDNVNVRSRCSACRGRAWNELERPAAIGTKFQEA